MTARSPAAPTGLGDIGTNCLTNGLCAPDQDAAQESDLCPALGALCDSNGENPPDWLPKVFDGHYSGFDGCPTGTLNFTLHGNWAGEPANY